MTIAHVAGQGGGNYADNTTAVTRAFGSAVTAGNLVVILGMKWSGAADAFLAGDCTQSAGTASLGTISLDRATTVAHHGGGSFGHAGIWSAIVTGSGTLTMQIDGALAGSYLLIATDEFSGTWDASRVEVVNGVADVDGGTSASSGSVTSAGAALLAACLQVNAPAAVTITDDAAFTLTYKEASGAHDVGSAIYRIVPTGTTDAADWTLSESDAFATAIVAYKEGGATAKSLVCRPRSQVLMPLLHF